MLNRARLKAKFDFPRVDVAAITIWFLILGIFKLYELFLQNPTLPAAERYGVVLSLSVLSFHVKYSELSYSIRILVRGLLALFLFYTLLAYTPHYPELLSSNSFQIYMDLYWGRSLAIAIGLVGFIRPSFALLPLTYLFWQKNMLSQVTGIGISYTDFASVAQTGQYAIICIIWFNVFHSLMKKAKGPAIADLAPRFYSWLFMTTIAFHLANYYYSALKKIEIGGNPFVWISENPTAILFINSIHGNQFFNFLSVNTQTLIYHSLGWLLIPMNLFTLSVQIVVIVAILRRRWTIVVLALLDLMHVGIFFVSAIFFWKWLILNALFIFALSRDKYRPSWSHYRILLPFVILAAPLFFSTAALGWFDTPAMNILEIHAITKDGKDYSVPSNYFLALSLPFAQLDYVAPHREQVATGTYGATTNYHTFIYAKKCELGLNSDGESFDKAIERTRLAAYILAHHHFIVANSNANGVYNYDLYPHHIWSNIVEDHFYSLDKRKISEYRIVSKSICTDLSTLEAKQLRMPLVYSIPVD